MRIVNILLWNEGSSIVVILSSVTVLATGRRLCGDVRILVQDFAEQSAMETGPMFRLLRG